MQLALLLVFIAVPLLEIAILIKVGGLIGFWLTMAIVILTAVVGTTIMHRQGMAALLKAQSSMQEGKIPVVPVVDGAFLLVAGAFLLTPGLLTDAAGFVLLVPPFRRALARWAFKKVMQGGRVQGGVFRGGATADLDGDEPRDRSAERARPRQPSGAGPVIEGEFERVEEKTIDPHRRR